MHHLSSKTRGLSYAKMVHGVLHPKTIWKGKGGRQMVKTEYISRFECHFYSFSLQSKVLGFVVKTKI